MRHILYVTALCVFFAGCTESAPFPSYSGIYTLESVIFEGSDIGPTAGDQPADTPDPDGFTFPTNRPQTLTVVQDILSRGISIGNNHNVTVVNTDNESLLISSDLNDSSHAARDIFAPYSYDDTNSIFLGFDQGYACKFRNSAVISIAFTPEKQLLDQAYPHCTDLVQTTRGELCVQRRNWTDEAVRPEQWRAAGPVILTVTVSASKSLTSGETPCYQHGTTTRMTGSFASITLNYRRVAAAETFDLRRSSGSVPELDAILRDARALPDGSRAILDLPARAQDLTLIWPTQ